MYHIFEENRILPMEQVPEDYIEAYGDLAPIVFYILRRVAIVCPKIYKADADAIISLARYVDKVIKAGENLSLLPLLSLIEEELQTLLEQGGISDENFDRFTFVLGFLEVDILNDLKQLEVSDQLMMTLGRIRRLKEQYLKEATREKKPIKKPTEIKAYLDSYIIGQDDAKKVVASAVYGHMKRIHHKEVPFAGDVVLLIGPSGCGKTEIMRRIRELVDVPMVFTDVSNLGAEQFKGRHKSDILLELYDAANGDLHLAEQGIVFMDEFDKLLLPAISDRGVDAHDDVQSQLLTMLEGSDVEVKSGNTSIVMNTSRILFVLAGAFQGIEDCIYDAQVKKENISGTIGFGGKPKKEMDVSYLKEHIDHEVLMAYGVKRELAGRIGSITVLNAMTRESLLRILKEPKDNVIEKYQREIKLSSGANLIFKEEALEAVVDEVLKEKTGARALFAKLQKIMGPILYKAPSYRGSLQSIIVSAETVKQAATAEYVFLGM